jgi:segregation and condensation protein A
MANPAFNKNTALSQPDIDLTLEIYEDVNKKAENSVDGIEILVEMSKKGKIDPWNIDIADITDKYLQKLVEIKSNNLKLTGRTLFFAAVLLRLKSDILEGISLENDDFQGNEFLENFDNTFDDDYESINTSNVISIDDVLERRTSVKLHRERIITLDDLIKQLEFYEKIDKRLAFQNKNNRALRRARSYEKFTPEDIINMAHDEYIESSIKILQIALERIFQTDKRASLSELNETGMDKVSIYIALLFIATSNDIDLVQDEFYSELYVVNETKTLGGTDFQDMENQANKMSYSSKAKPDLHALPSVQEESIKVEID